MKWVLVWTKPQLELKFLTVIQSNQMYESVWFASEIKLCQSNSDCTIFIYVGGLAAKADVVVPHAFPIFCPAQPSRIEIVTSYHSSHVWQSGKWPKLTVKRVSRYLQRVEGRMKFQYASLLFNSFVSRQDSIIFRYLRRQSNRYV